MCNRHNEHHWADENPHINRLSKHQVYWNFSAWCGIIHDRVVGPVFYEGALTGVRYLDLIINGIVTEFLDDLPLNQYDAAYYQQDGAPAHNYWEVSRKLYDLFDDR